MEKCEYFGNLAYQLSDNAKCNMCPKELRYKCQNKTVKRELRKGASDKELDEQESGYRTMVGF